MTSVIMTTVAMTNVFKTTVVVTNAVAPKEWRIKTALVMLL